MKKLKPVLLLVLIFAAGLCIGTVGTRVALRHWVRQAVQNPDVVRLRVERDLVRKLKLNVRQRVSVRQVLSQSQNEIKALRREFQPRYVAILSHAQENITAVLTPEQRQEFEQYRAENQSLWEVK